MKKFTLVFLMAAMMFVLCGSGLQNITQEERLKVFYQMAAERGLDKVFEIETELTQDERELIFYQVAAEMGLMHYVTDGRPIYISAPSDYVYAPPAPSPYPEDVDFIEIIDMALVPVDNGIYRPNLKIKNIFPEDMVEVYPEDLRIFVKYLDKDGAVVHSTMTLIEHLGFGQTQWTEAASTIGIWAYTFDSFDISEISEISVSGYRFTSVRGGSLVYKEDFTFTPAITFNVGDMLPENSVSESSKNSVTVEEARVISDSSSFRIEAKIRNTSAVKRDVIIAHFQVLDKNGDVLDTGEITVRDLEPGQAATKESYTCDCNSDDVGAIKFNSYSYGYYWSDSNTSYVINDGYDFDEAFVFKP